jgi:flagellin
MGTPDGDTTTKAIATPTAGTASTIEVSTLTVGGTYAAGDVISVNLNQNTFQYTVTTADAVSSSALSTNLATALNTRFDDGFAITQSGAGVIKFTLDSNAGTEAGNSFTLTANNSDGEWDDLETLKVDTQSNSNSAIEKLDVSITKVNKARAEIGAVINRLTYAVDNLTNVSANATASRSRIEDTDYAKATTNLARSQIIQQAATAMLAQANQQPQSVLSLLK